MGFKQICGLYGFAEDIFDFLPRFFLAMQQQSSACFFYAKILLKTTEKTPKYGGNILRAKQ
jgi:hypothetical protein